jgi:predicted DCC family thiol-disulfide oxidoreductase YuxK
MTGTVVYDADCGFCTSSADWLARHGRSSLQPAQTLDLAAAGLTEQDVVEAAWYLRDGQPPLRGARAAAAALRDCGLPWRLLGHLIDLPPVRPLAAAVYAVVARNRHRLPGSTDACRLP